MLTDNWLKMYLYARSYYLKYNDLLIPERYSFYVNGKNINLGKWLSNQRNLYKKGLLEIEKQLLLEDIKVSWHNIKTGIKKDYNKELKEFLVYYNEVLKYFKEHGNSIIREDYKVGNLEVGLWYKVTAFKYLKHQLLKEEINLLENIEINKYIEYNKRRGIL